MGRKKTHIFNTVQVNNKTTFKSIFCISPAGGATALTTALNKKKKPSTVFFLYSSNMASARRLKRVVASQPGFLALKGSSDPSGLVSTRRKRVNKNKKKNWGKHSDINDVEEFLEDVRLQERATG